MGITVIQDSDKYGNTRAIMVCNTTEKALEPVFSHKRMAEDFIAWLDKDPREIPDGELEIKAEDFKKGYDPETFKFNGGVVEK